MRGIDRDVAAALRRGRRRRPGTRVLESVFGYACAIVAVTPPLVLVLYVPFMERHDTGTKVFSVLVGLAALAFFAPALRPRWQRGWRISHMAGVVWAIVGGLSAIVTGIAFLATDAPVWMGSFILLAGIVLTVAGWRGRRWSGPP